LRELAGSLGHVRITEFDHSAVGFCAQLRETGYEAFCTIDVDLGSDLRQAREQLARPLSALREELVSGASRRCSDSSHGDENEGYL